MLTEEADKLDERRIHKILAEKESVPIDHMLLCTHRANNLCHRKLLTKKKLCEDRLGARGTGLSVAQDIRLQIEGLDKQIASLENDESEIQGRILHRHEEDGKAQTQSGGSTKLPNESQRDFLLRTGKITPFSILASERHPSSNLQEMMLEVESGVKDRPDETVALVAGDQFMSHQNLRAPGFLDEESEEGEIPEEPLRSNKRRKIQPSHDAETGEDLKARSVNGIETRVASEDSDNFVPDLDDRGLAALGEDETDEYDEDNLGSRSSRKRKATRISHEEKASPSIQEDLSNVDDGNENIYQARLKTWVEGRSEARKKAIEKRLVREGQPLPGVVEGDGEDEWCKPHPTQPSTVLEGDFRIPGDVYQSLFDYQKTGVQWLCQLYKRSTGGIIGDEMGLGKTIQIIGFLAGLHHSDKLKKPVVIVCPATVMKQWVTEFHRWWPPLRVSILHSSGSGMLNVRSEEDIERRLIDREYRRGSESAKLPKSHKKAKKIVEHVQEFGHVLITTYAGLKTYSRLLTPIHWECAVLDEGHQIKNPDAEVTYCCKNLITPNRFILSGTPIQNNLTELWSLFDFIFPMRLGTLVDFREQFEIPIKIGGYANATNLQIQTATKCATVLKETIGFNMLRRMKLDVASDLPKKSEWVVFVKLTKRQREVYETYLRSEEIKSVLSHKRNMLSGVAVLRQICNHPDLVKEGALKEKEGHSFGSGAKSGKLQFVKESLNQWKAQGHKALIFSQSRGMLDIIQKYIGSMAGIVSLRMDGTTPIPIRQGLVDEFNNTPNINVFLLTTRVGGLGINLTAASRVIIIDPDWNPSTDQQARERSWRLGQKKEVQIFRLLTKGTIEEKIYHRQIFKQYLTDKVLKDPQRQRVSKLDTLADLFILGSNDDSATETSKVFDVDEKGYWSGDKLASDSKGSETDLGHPVVESFANSASIARMERYHADKEEQTKPVTGEETLAEKRLLDDIFTRSGVQSLIEHDQIIDGRKKIQADPQIIAREADRIAAEAAASLRESARLAETVPIGTPTWTGVTGIAGRPGANARGQRSAGPASASILAGLQNRRGVDSEAGDRSGSNSPRPGTQGGRRTRTAPGQEFAQKIRDFLRAHNGKARSQMIVNHFNHQVTPDLVPVFQATLNRVATLEKGRFGQGRGVWTLKAEFS